MNNIDYKAKFRIIVTAEQIITIVDLCKVPPLTVEKMNLMTTFAPLLTKVQTGAIKPAYTIKEPVKLEVADLGGFNFPVQSMNKKLYWAGCYNKYINPLESCSEEELNAAYQHMYLNDLMTPEQVGEFESTNTLSVTK